jgi:hypothetical protein
LGKNSKLSIRPHQRHILNFPVSENFAKDDGAGEVVLLNFYIGEELLVEGGLNWVNTKKLNASGLICSGGL